MGLRKGGLSGAAACWEDIHPGFFTKVENESTSLSLETGLLLKLRGQLRRFASGFRAGPPHPTPDHMLMVPCLSAFSPAGPSRHLYLRRRL